MTMLSKCSFLATAVALLFSLNAGAMAQDQSCGKQLKKGDCLEVGQEGDCDQLSDQLGKSKISEASCSSSQAQQTCGATFDRSQCEQNKDKRWLHRHYRDARSQWFTKIRVSSPVMTRADWRNSQWANVGSDNVKMERVALNGSTLQNVSLKGKFNHVHFDDGTIVDSTFSGKFSDTDFANTRLTNVQFVKATFEKHHEHVPVLGRKSNFDGATLTNVQFIESSLGDMTFRDAHLTDVTFPCSDIKITSCFEDANVWNPASGRWVKLSGKALQKLGAHMSSCHAGAVNLSAWLHTQHPSW